MAKNFLSLFKKDAESTVSEKTAKDKVSPPYLFIAGYLDNIDKKDAIQYVKNLMLSMCSSLDYSGYFIMPYLDGFAYEIHEGGSRHSYLKWIIDALAQSSNGKIAFQTAAHVISIEKSTKGFVTMMIPESTLYKEAILQPEGQGVLANYAIDKTKYIAVLMYFFVSSCVLMVLVVLIKISILMAAKDIDKLRLAQKMEQLPILQWPQNKLAKNTYIDKLTYADGKWSILAKSITDESGNKAEQLVSDKNAVAGAQLDSPMKKNTQKIIQVPTISGDKIIAKPVPLQARP